MILRSSKTGCAEKTKPIETGISCQADSKEARVVNLPESLKLDDVLKHAL